jgi:hypothetical protein
VAASPARPASVSRTARLAGGVFGVAVLGALLPAGGSGGAGKSPASASPRR